MGVKPTQLKKLPDWMDHVADDSLIRTADMAKHLGVSASTVTQMVKSGRLPNYDTRQGDLRRAGMPRHKQTFDGSLCRGHDHTRFWRASTLRKFVEKADAG